MSTDRDYVVLVNHTSKAVMGSVTATSGSGQAYEVTPEGIRPVGSVGNAWPFELPGFTGTVFEWRRA